MRCCRCLSIIVASLVFLATHENLADSRVTVVQQLHLTKDLSDLNLYSSEKRALEQNSKTKQQNNIMLSSKILRLSIGSQGFRHELRGGLNTMARRGFTASPVRLKLSGYLFYHVVIYRIRWFRGTTVPTMSRFHMSTFRVVGPLLRTRNSMH